MEVTRDQYARIANRASRLFDLISRTMEDVKPPAGERLPQDWHELHDLMNLALVIIDTAGRYRDRAELPADPIDLTLTSAVDADGELSCYADPF